MSNTIFFYFLYSFSKTDRSAFTLTKFDFKITIHELCVQVEILLSIVSDHNKAVSNRRSYVCQMQKNKGIARLRANK